MEPGDWLRVIVILTGIFLLVVTFFSLARRRMTEPICLTWGLISVIMFLAGILLRPTELSRYISETGLILVGMIGFCIVFGLYFMSVRLSELMRRNLELAMQVSMLGMENEEIKKKLEELSKNEDQLE